MQPAAFQFDIDDRLGAVRINMSGFFDSADVARFIAARDATYRSLALPPGAHVTLVDIRDMMIQSQERVAEFQKALANPAARSRRIAFVVSRSLARQQVRRVAETRDARLFESVEDAEHWLSEGGTPPRAG